MTEMSDQRAVETAAEVRRWPIGRGELHRWVAEEGAALETVRAAETEPILGTHPDRRTRPRRGGTVWVSADGTMVHDRASGTVLEVTIGLVFDGARRVGRGRRSLTGRTLDAGTESWTAFAERFTALCTRLGVSEAERICFVSDGAAAIRWIRERAFPDAIELLDWDHLVEAFRRAIGDERNDRLELALAVAAPGDAERLLDLLADWAHEEAGVEVDIVGGDAGALPVSSLAGAIALKVRAWQARQAARDVEDLVRLLALVTDVEAVRSELKAPERQALGRVGPLADGNHRAWRAVPEPDDAQAAFARLSD